MPAGCGAWPLHNQADPMASRLFSNLRQHPRAKLAAQASLAALVPAAPILYWSHTAKKERAEREHEVKTRIR